MKIALAQINPIIGDFDYNFNKIKSFADKAASLSCDLAVFSELVISGYPPRDLLEKKDFADANIACLNRLISSVRGIGVICGFVEKNPGNEGNPLYNSAVLFEDGKILYQVRKRLLPTYDVFDEARYFEPGTEFESCSYKGRRIGLTVCEDMWNDKDIFKRRFYHADPVALMVKDGADMILNVSASPYHAGKREFKWNLLGSVARKYGIPVVAVNQVGGNDSLLFDGISAAFDSSGNRRSQACDFREDLVIFDSETFEGDIHGITASDTESVLNALIMGTHDYMKKCGFSKAVIGLSGGIDSALTAYIAAEALGRENVLTVFMPSPYTSRENYEDTRQFADNLGLEYTVIPIDDIFRTFLKVLSPDFNDDPGITEQNIQARIRGTLLMGISNRDGSLLLSTGNKSELAVGYCTMYGDMNGGLAVISDVPKTMVYEISRFINREKDFIPSRIIEKAPSAELSPDQTDQDDLPAYSVLDAILKGYVEELKSPDQLAAEGFDKKLVADVISRISRNEYKRHQAAPGLKVTSKAFGYGRRYPLAQRYSPKTSEV